MIFEQISLIQFLVIIIPIIYNL